MRSRLEGAHTQQRTAAAVRSVSGPARAQRYASSMSVRGQAKMPKCCEVGGPCEPSEQPGRSADKTEYTHGYLVDRHAQSATACSQAAWCNTAARYATLPRGPHGSGSAGVKGGRGHQRREKNYSVVFRKEKSFFLLEARPGGPSVTVCAEVWEFSVQVCGDRETLAFL